MSGNLLWAATIALMLGASPGVLARSGPVDAPAAVARTAVTAVGAVSGEDSAAKLMKEEELPLATESATLKAAPRYHAREWLLMIVVFLATGGATAAAVRYLKRKGGFRGTRKYLIEQLSYCPLGGKNGVSLLKIGGEFVLVGVTPTQVTFLSQLPKLEAQYEEDAQLERGAFREAVREELSRIHGTQGMEAHS